MDPDVGVDAGGFDGKHIPTIVSLTIWRSIGVVAGPNLSLFAALTVFVAILPTFRGSEVLLTLLSVML